MEKTPTLVADPQQEMPPPRVAEGSVAGRPLRVGIISNPKSGQNARKGLLAAIDELLVGYPQVLHRRVETLNEMYSAAEELTDAGMEILVANGGDGTVQAILTALLRPTRESLPVLAVLPGGTSNSSARNVGYSMRALPSLRTLLHAANHGILAGRIQPNPVLCTDTGRERQYSMMFGTGAVYHGIGFAHQEIGSRGVHGQALGALGILTFIVKLLMGRSDDLFPPMHADIRVDGEILPKEEYLAALASTMDRQIVGIRPYWGTGPGPVRITILRTLPSHVARTVVALFQEKKPACLNPSSGWRSVNAHEVVLTVDCGFTLDGELFHLEGVNQTITLSARQKAYFLRA